MTFKIIARRTFIFRTKAVPVEICLETLSGVTLTEAIKHLNDHYILYKGLNYDYYYIKDADGGRWKVSAERVDE